MRKRILVVVVLLCSACVGGGFLWQARMDGDYFNVEIHRISDEMQYITTLTNDALTVYEVDSDGVLELKQSIDVFKSGASLNMLWLDATNFVTAYLGDAIRLNSIDEGVVWALTSEEIASNLESGNQILGPFKLAKSSDDELLILGQSYQAYGTFTNGSVFIQSYTQDGIFKNSYEVLNARSIDLRYQTSDFHIISYIARDESNIARRVTAKFDNDLAILPLRDFGPGEVFAAGYDQGYLTKPSAIGSIYLQFYNWDDQMLWEVSRDQYPIEAFGDYTDGIVIRDRLGFTIFDFDGAIVREVPMDFGYQTIVKVDQFGQFLIAHQQQFQMLGGVKIEPMISEESVGLDIDGKIYQYDQVKFQVGSLISGSRAVYNPKQHRETILLNDCNLWCRWEEGVDFEPGTCDLHDVALNNDGSFISATTFCDGSGFRSALDITKY